MASLYLDGNDSDTKAAIKASTVFKNKLSVRVCSGNNPPCLEISFSGLLKDRFGRTPYLVITKKDALRLINARAE